LFNGSSPGLGSFLSALQAALVVGAVAALVIFVIRHARTARVAWLWLGGLLLLVSLGPAHAHSIREFMVGWTMHSVPLALTVAITAVFLRSNVAAYLGTAFCVAVIQPLITLFTQPEAFYRWNGVLLAVLAAAFLAWLLAVGTRQVDDLQPTANS
jgi:hypothetical protein